MTRGLLAAWLWLFLPVLPAGAAVSEVPPIPAAVGEAPGAAASSLPSAAAAVAGALPSAAPAPVPTAPLAPALAAPTPLPAASADRPGDLRYSPALPPDAELGPLPTDKPDGLRQLRLSLEARGDRESLRAAEALYYTDPLTGLPNRAFFVEHGERVLSAAEDPTVALLDMDNFGAVNVGLADVRGVTKGRERADRVLAIAGAELGRLADAAGVTVTRLGGEEFAVLGSRERVRAFAAAARGSLTPRRTLRAAGIRDHGRDARAIEAAMTRLGRGDQPIGDFTYGLAPAKGLPATEALKAADAALNAAKEAGRRGSINLAEAGGGSVEWTPPESPAPPPDLPAPAARDTAADFARLEARLTPHERLLLREASFRDPLTLTRTYDYALLQAPEWDREYASGGAVVLSSARNLKQINDILGHEAGDRYLRRLGVILRQTVIRLRRRRKMDVQEPVRVASKEFLLVGRDADAASRLAAEAVARSFDDGRMLTPEEVARLRKEVVGRGLAPEARARLIGTLRVVSERLDGRPGRTDVMGALDRAFIRLEDEKRAEDEGVPPPSMN
jgi:GGDEF domain-containing protein